MNSRQTVCLARVKKRHKCKFVPRHLSTIVATLGGGGGLIVNSFLSLRFDVSTTFVAGCLSSVLNET